MGVVGRHRNGHLVRSRSTSTAGGKEKSWNEYLLLHPLRGSWKDTGFKRALATIPGSRLSVDPSLTFETHRGKREREAGFYILRN